REWEKCVELWDDGLTDGHPYFTFVEGRHWSKPVIVDEPSCLDGIYTSSYRTDPPRKPWPYPRPTLTYWQQQWFAYASLSSVASFFSAMLRAVFPGATSGDLARITKMRLKEWDRKMPGKPAPLWTSVYSFGKPAWGPNRLTYSQAGPTVRTELLA